MKVVTTAAAAVQPTTATTADRTRSMVMSAIVMLIFVAMGVPSCLSLMTVALTEQFTTLEPIWLTNLLLLIPAATSQPATVLAAFAEAVPLLLVRTCFNSGGTSLSFTGGFGLVVLLIVAIASVLSIVILDPASEAQSQNITGGIVTLQALDTVCANTARVCLLYAAGLLGLKQFAKLGGAGSA